MTTREVLKYTFHLELKHLFGCFLGPKEAARMSSFPAVSVDADGASGNCIVLKA